jgi:hypothetical protein
MENLEARLPNGEKVVVESVESGKALVRRLEGNGKPLMLSANCLNLRPFRCTPRFGGLFP